MSIERVKKEAVVLATGLEGEEAQIAADVVPGKQQSLLLEVEEDDFGGDPYNRTGTFCQIELKNKVQ